MLLSTRAGGVGLNLQVPSSQHIYTQSLHYSGFDYSIRVLVNVSELAQAADIVVLIDGDWNPQMDLQVGVLGGKNQFGLWVCFAPLFFFEAF